MHEFSTKQSSCILFPQPNLFLTTSNRTYTRIHPSSCKLNLYQHRSGLGTDDLLLLPAAAFFALHQTTIAAS